MEKNPKETAIELIKQFENVPMLQDYGGMDIGLAKECAIIAIDNIIKSNAIWHEESIPYKFWTKVAKEIINHESNYKI